MADTPRMTALRNLSNQLPIANTQLAQQQKAARAIQLQQAVKQAPTNVNTTQAAQQTGAAVAQTAGQQMVENAASQVKQQGQVGNIGLAAQQDQFQQQQASARMGARQSAMDNVERLAKLDMNAKQELYDKQIQFDRDEAGRTLFNERQLQDYIKSSALSDEQARNYTQMMNQASDRKLQVMRRAYELASEDLQQKYQIAKQQGDQQAANEIYRIRQDMENRIREEENAAANKAAREGAIGTIAGTAVGAFIGGAGGAQAGGQIGGGAAKALGGAF